MVVDEEKILSFVRTAGPVIPVQLAKHIGTNILFASAMLGELASKGKLKISHVKVGGTPLYYLPGQEHKLQQYAKNLHEKEQKAYDLLRQNKVLQDSHLDAVTRVALRNIKDFAVPLEVTISQGMQPEIFWKWYLLSNEEAEKKIRSMLGLENKKPTTQPQTKEEKQPSQQKHDETKDIKDPQSTKPEQEPTNKQNHVKQQSSDDFLKSLYAFFKQNEIDVLDEKIIRKGSDAEFTVKIPSPIGKLAYFVKAKSKKSSNDADISSAFLQGQRKNLPVIYLTTGNVTKKAKKMAEKDFPSLIIIELNNTE